jgi:hypothetical protein
MGVFCQFLAKRKIFLGLYYEKFRSSEEFLQAISEKTTLSAAKKENKRCFRNVKFYKKS